MLAIDGDVRDEETATDAVGATVHRFGRLDAIVSNAGAMIRKPLHRLTLSEWHRVLDTNLTAAFLLARAAERPLRKARGAFSAAIVFGRQYSLNRANFSSRLILFISAASSSP